MIRRLLTGLVLMSVLSACESESQYDDPTLAEGVLIECSVMTNEAGYSRRLETESPRLWDLHGEGLATKGWEEDDPVEITVRIPTAEEQEYFDTALGGGSGMFVTVELHNARNGGAESLSIPGLTRGETTDEMLRQLGYEIFVNTSRAAYNPPFAGPFSRGRQLPPQIEQEMLGRYAERFRSVEGPFLGECRTR